MRRGAWESSFPPSCGDTIIEYCGRYTVGYGVGCGGRPGHRPWSCGDRAGVLPTSAGGAVVTVECSVPRMWHSLGPTS